MKRILYLESNVLEPSEKKKFAFKLKKKIIIHFYIWYIKYKINYNNIKIFY